MNLIRTASVEDLRGDPRSRWAEPHRRGDSAIQIYKYWLMALYRAEAKKRNDNLVVKA